MTRRRVVFAGARGRMGRALLPGLRQTPDLAVVGEVEIGDDLVTVAREAGAEVVVDFTTPQAAVGNARAILAAGAQGVIGTTGFRPDDLARLDEEARAAGRGLLVAPNFALGMVLLQRFADEAARHFPRVEIVEAHHEGKADAPSGTALATARRMAAAGAHPAPADEAPSRGLDVAGIRVHSLRLPGVLARQEVHLGGTGETLLLRHDALGRDCYLPGVVAAIRAMPGRVGLVHGLDALLFEDATPDPGTRAPGPPRNP
jgi:4-hydroxy-tetrahydrodipicolinate reductase